MPAPDAAQADTNGSIYMRLAGIRQRIRAGTFYFDEEFPEYRFIGRVIGSLRLPARTQRALATADRIPPLPAG